MTTKVTQSMMATNDTLLAAKAPIPTAVSGVGEFKRVTGSTFTLPSGGTWAWMAIKTVDATGVVGYVGAGVDAGGTVAGASAAGSSWYGMAWRVA